tara:strand:- start:202 stop:717 length:516 start_codon:yes stop_codon:yes gene_type:complete
MSRVKELAEAEKDNFEKDLKRFREKNGEEDKIESAGEGKGWKKTVGAIIIDNSKILLVKRVHEPFKGKWAIPGGHMELKEKDTDAVIREVNEETGLDFKPNYFGSYEERFEKIEWFAYVSIFDGSFNGKIDKRKLNKKEISDIKWFKFDELKNIEMAFNHGKIIEEYLSSN